MVQSARVMNMLYAEPDFFRDFSCLASRCRHSCCVGWEIDIDGETAGYYKSISGRLGAELREKTAMEPEPHFRLDGEERCPFLNEKGLCRLILALGEDALCDICREHPRFYNDFPGRHERGLGLCCEAAASLLLRGREPLKILEQGDEEGAKTPLLILREKIFGLLGNKEKPLFFKMREAARLCGMKMPEPDMAFWAGFYLTLERLDKNWTHALTLLLNKGKTVNITQELDQIEYERIAEYFVYRHFASAKGPEEAGERLAFAFLSAAFVCTLDVLEGKSAEHLRLYSAEIEYSDENIGKILAEIRRRA